MRLRSIGGVDSPGAQEVIFVASIRAAWLFRHSSEAKTFRQLVPNTFIHEHQTSTQSPKRELRLILEQLLNAACRLFPVPQFREACGQNLKWRTKTWILHQGSFS